MRTSNPETWKLIINQSFYTPRTIPLIFLLIQSNLSNSSQPVIRDKKSAGNSYSAAGDDDINDVAAMGGVNLQEEANVSVLYFIQTRETGFYKYRNISMFCWNTSLD